MANNVKHSVHNRKIMWKSTLIILIGVAIMSVLTVYIINKSPTMKETLDAERPVERETIVHLFAFESDDNGSKHVISETVAQGRALTFTLSTNVPIHVTLLSMMNEQRPDVLFSDARIPPGEGRQLSKGLDQFIYKIPKMSKGQVTIKFCLVQGSSPDALSKKLRRLLQTWKAIPATQCLTVSAV